MYNNNSKHLKIGNAIVDRSEQKGNITLRNIPFNLTSRTFKFP